MTTPCRPSAPPVSLELVGDLAQHQRDAERHHQPGQVGAAQDQEAGGEAEHAAAKTPASAQHRLGHDAVLGQQRRRIGADAEEGGVTERDDAGIAEDQVEREREQGEPMAISVRIRCLPGSRNAQASAAKPERDSSGCQRARRGQRDDAGDLPRRAATCGA